MVSDQTSPKSQVALALDTREQADRLLQRLSVDSTLSRERMAAAGKRDALRRITGTSAMDRAIGSLNDMITDLDELIADLEARVAAHEGERSGAKVLQTAT